MSVATDLSMPRRILSLAWRAAEQPEDVVACEQFAEFVVKFKPGEMGEHALDVETAVRVIQLATSWADEEEDAYACRAYADFLDDVTGQGITMEHPFGGPKTVRGFVDGALAYLESL